MLVLAGDVWARGILARRLPTSLHGRILTAGGGPAPQTGRALLEGQLDRLFTGRMTSHDRALVGTGAELILVREEQVNLHEGVGVLLRYADRTA
ncbi:hypothetical protein ADL29_07780 [Streptomyces chattanoogensis]|uniref:Uncharacterized protein n=1 Tax=Streptomyces chattanoogensis TaxID=66876 RepID=A0A0N0XXX2_9ACTN|nr:hypothetical protein ADL29_07780 [Streptomyces chattanoogensis]